MYQMTARKSLELAVEAEKAGVVRPSASRGKCPLNEPVKSSRANGKHPLPLR